VESNERKQTEDIYRRAESQGGLGGGQGVKTINEIAQGYGVHPTQVNQRKRELLDNAGSLFEGKRGPKPVNAQGDPDRLYAKIGQLNMELDWLKRKSGIDL
jgi:transposase